jgi:hypothetical protein
MSSHHDIRSVNNHVLKEERNKENGEKGGGRNRRIFLRVKMCLTTFWSDFPHSLSREHILIRHFLLAQSVLAHSVLTPGLLTSIRLHSSRYIIWQFHQIYTSEFLEPELLIDAGCRLGPGRVDAGLGKAFSTVSSKEKSRFGIILFLYLWLFFLCWFLVILGFFCGFRSLCFWFFSWLHDSLKHSSS